MTRVQSDNQNQAVQLSDYVRRHRAIWVERPALREIYRRWYDAILRECHPGRTLEIGAGCGNFKEYCPSLISSDVTPAPWVDICADGAHLPFRHGVFDNVVGVDVLHHVFDPDLVLNEIARVTRPGGRAVFIEPYVSPWARVVRGLFHHEKQDLSRDVIYGPDKRPEDSNLAIPTRVFVKNRREFARRFGRFSLRKVVFSDILAYPLSCGFRRRGLLPDFALRWVSRIEPAFDSLAGVLGFKMLIVLEIAHDNGPVQPKP